MRGIPVLQPEPKGFLESLLTGFGTGFAPSFGQAAQSGFENMVLQSALEGQDITKDPQAFLAALMGAPVTPQTRQGYLQNIAAVQSLAPQPAEPALNLNQELTKLKERTKQDIDQVLRPYAVMDNLGRFIAFKGDPESEPVKAVISKVDKLIEKQKKTIAKLHQRFGQPIPPDIEEDFENDVRAQFNNFNQIGNGQVQGEVTGTPYDEEKINEILKLFSQLSG